MKDKLVSVIISTLNAEKYIERALNSISQQDYSNIEIIVIDAGSKDLTKEICSHYKLVKFFTLKNSSMGEARNYGINLSKGEYLMFLDADDFYLQNKVTFQVNKLMENNSLDFVANTAFLIRNSNEKVIGTKKFTLGKLQLVDFLEGKCYSLGALCIKKKSLKNNSIYFDEGQKGYFGEDWSFQLKLSYYGLNYKYFTNQLIIIDLRDNSFVRWDDEFKRKENTLSIVEKLLIKNNQKFISEKKLKLILNEHLLKLAISYFINSLYSKGYKTLKKISNKKNLRFIIIIISSLILPRIIFVYILKITWKLSQKKSFKWSSPKLNLKKWIIKNNLFLR